MELNRTYNLSPHVVLRPERFGGLIYRHDNRRLYFLNSQVLVELLTELDGTQRLGDVLEAFVASRGLGPGDRRTLETALARLERMGILSTSQSALAGSSDPAARRRIWQSAASHFDLLILHEPCTGQRRNV